jgi:hypothetical protein
LIAKDEVKKPVLRNMAVTLREYAPGNTIYMDYSTPRKAQVLETWDIRGFPGFSQMV